MYICDNGCYFDNGVVYGLVDWSVIVVRSTDRIIEVVNLINKNTDARM